MLSKEQQSRNIQDFPVQSMSENMNTTEQCCRDVNKHTRLDDILQRIPECAESEITDEILAMIVQYLHKVCTL